MKIWEKENIEPPGLGNIVTHPYNRYPALGFKFLSIALEFHIKSSKILLSILLHIAVINL